MAMCLIKYRKSESLRKVGYKKIYIGKQQILYKKLKRYLTYTKINFTITLDVLNGMRAVRKLKESIKRKQHFGITLLYFSI